jgi:hypothetical protein
MPQPIEYNLRRASEIIQQIEYATVATVSNEGEPWNSPVFTAFDNNLNFFWVSDKEGQHSKNVQSNGKSFVVIYDSTMPAGTGEGVYFQATVDALQDEDEILTALKVLDGREGNIRKHVASDYTNSSVRYVYRARPSKFWINDIEVDKTGNFIRDIRVELPLDKIKSEI